MSSLLVEMHQVLIVLVSLGQDEAQTKFNLVRDDQICLWVTGPASEQKPQDFGYSHNFLRAKFLY